VDPNLTNQYTEQFFIGLERQVAPDLGIDVSFVVKNEHDFIRVKDQAGVYATQPFIDTFNGVTQTVSVYNLVSPSSQSLFQTTNRNDFQQEYKSFVVQVNKRLSSHWQLLGSYQWERSLGDNTGVIAITSQNFGGGVDRTASAMTWAIHERGGPFPHEQYAYPQSEFHGPVTAGFPDGLVESPRPHGRMSRSGDWVKVRETS
jgi:hypothetical protein